MSAIDPERPVGTAAASNGSENLSAMQTQGSDLSASLDLDRTRLDSEAQRSTSLAAPAQPQALAQPIDLTGDSDSDSAMAIDTPPDFARQARVNHAETWKERSRVPPPEGVNPQTIASPSNPGAEGSNDLDQSADPTHGAASGSGLSGGKEMNAVGVVSPRDSHKKANSDSDDDFTITASTAPTRPSTLPSRHFGDSNRGTTTSRTQGSHNNMTAAGINGALAGSLTTPTIPTLPSHSSPSLQNRLHQQQQLARQHRFIQPNFSNNNSFASASTPAHAAGFSAFRNNTSNFGNMSGFGSPGSGSGSFIPSIPGVPSLPTPRLNGDGSAAAPIDVDSVSPSRNLPPRQPICIGGFMSRAIMLYPKSAVTAGDPTPPDSKEQWEVVHYRGVEMVHVRLKLRKAGSIPRPDEPWSPPSCDTIQVMTPGQTQYIGDLDPHTAEVLIPMLHRGLCRLEGFAVRLPKEAVQYECKVNVLIFTLPSNVKYIAETLGAHSLFLLDPLPPYDPGRHTDGPEYHNAHGSGDRAMQLYQAYRRAQQGTNNGQYFNAAMDKARQVEVQRKQAEAILDQLTDGVELEQSDPGPYIRTELFPHQRKALTFLLQGEQDQRSLKEARKHAEKKLVKAKEEAGEEDVKDERGQKERSRSRDVKDKDKESLPDFSRSLWEGEKDDKGRLRIWKNKVTGEKRRMKKHERPADAKGAILADDMGLGKTLSVVSLIAATRSAANEWAAKPLDTVAPPPDISSSNLDSSAMSTRVFGMPDDVDPITGVKKRKRDEPADAQLEHNTRRARIVKRAKGTLLVCPMSTMTNWEDQIKEHWDGKVEVIGGVGTAANVKSGRDDGLDDWDIFRVYIYHGASRNMDPRFLAEFDLVITSYSTLANEYSKQCATCGDGDSTPLETGAANSDDDTNAVDSSRTSLGNGTPDPDVVKPSELSEALRNQSKKGKGRRKIAPSGEQPSALQAIDWFRVVLDEAHSIKSASTIACKASCALEADRRIALTGTPIQNRVDDVWALFKFLRMSPIDEREVFTKYITTPCKTGEQVGVARLQLVMRTCTLRRTKDTVSQNGEKILDLPPRREIQMWLDLREDERKIYDARHEEIKGEIKELQDKKQLTKNYAHVLQHLLRLRQTCDHVDLPSSGPVEEDYDGTIMDYELAVQSIAKYGLNVPRAQSVISTLKDSTEGAVCFECSHDFGPLFPSIGLGGAEEEAAKPQPEIEGKKAKKPIRPILTKCMHILCPACFKRSVHTSWPKKTAGVSRQCAACETMLRVDLDVIEVPPPDSDEPEDQPKKIVRRKKWVRKDGQDISLSAKMEWLKEELLRHSKGNRYSDNYSFYEQIEPQPRFIDSEGNMFDSMDFDAEGLPMPSKGIIFSQWTTMLDRIEDMLIELKIHYCRLDGTMTREQRAQAMEDLRLKTKIEVMLVSTRAGGVGLNLTSASRAYLVDPYWNPSVEAQAIDRVHRLGQKRPVTAIRLMINNSVEERLDKIQKKKANLAQLSLKNMTRKELMEQRAEELATLFS